MPERFERLRDARRAAGYDTATAAADALGIPPQTYIHHENGTRDFARTRDPETARRYAAFFRVDLDWLLTGRGKMRRDRGGAPMRGVEIDGTVGAGSAVDFDDQPHAQHDKPTIDLPADEHLGALEVRGDSGWPRLLDGEFVLYDRRPTAPEGLIGRLAVIRTADGRSLIKTLRRGRRDGRFRLESHNAPPEDDVQILTAWRFVGILSQ